MPTVPPSHPLTLPLYLNAALLAILVLVLVGRGGDYALTRDALAQHQSAIGGGGGIFVVPAQFSVNTWGCYLLDVDSQTLSAYQFFPGERNLRLIAARHFRHDRRLERFNTSPSPQEVLELLEREAQPVRGRQEPPAPQMPQPE